MHPVWLCLGLLSCLCILWGGTSPFPAFQPRLSKPFQLHAALKTRPKASSQGLLEAGEEEMEKNRGWKRQLVFAALSRAEPGPEQSQGAAAWGRGGREGSGSAGAGRMPGPALPRGTGSDPAGTRSCSLGWTAGNETPAPARQLPAEPSSPGMRRCGVCAGAAGAGIPGQQLDPPCPSSRGFPSHCGRAPPASPAKGAQGRGANPALCSHPGARAAPPGTKGILRAWFHIPGCSRASPAPALPLPRFPGAGMLREKFLCNIK